MWYIIVGIIILGIIGLLLEWLAENIGILLVISIPVIILVASFLAWSWAGVFAVVVGCVVVGLLVVACIFVKDLYEQHDKNNKETAQINQKTQADRQIHNNDVALMEELSKNCCWLGYMSEEMWIKKLPNYASRQYSTDFRTITSNFAKQIEQQHILQNNDWFEPFKLYILKHQGGSTVTKMLHEVNCPQLKMTHSTPDGDLLNTWLVRGTQRANQDVPALFSSSFIKDVNESLFTPTPYLQKLYGRNNEGAQEVNHVEEINYDDL